MSFLTRRKYEEILPIRRPQRKSSWLIPAFTVFILSLVLSVAVVLHFSQQDPNDQAPNLSAANQNEESDTGDDEAHVTTEDGQIKGKIMLSRDGRSYLAFVGIPYAKPPIGNLRFSPTEQVDPWEVVLDTRTAKPQCMQLSKNKSTGDVSVVGSEDCLYVNVYTPKTKEDLNVRGEKFPVIFYIHGGINNGNGSQYGADYMMDEDVVLVIVHYRLHVFANLNTGDSVARGNLAIKDQVMGLKWIQRNIAKFGGDIRRVTIYGMSYGSILASMHLLSPMSKGLFHRVIMESGTALHPVLVSKDGRKITNALADIVKCPRNASSVEVLFCLRGIDARILTTAVRDLNFGFSIESKSENPSEDTCLTDEPLKLLQSGDINAVPSIHGISSAENLVKAMGILLNESNYNISESEQNEIIVSSLYLDQVPNSAAIVQTLREYYFESWNHTKDTLRQNLTNLLSDREWLHPMSTFLKYQLSAESQRQIPIFLYYFSKEVNSSFAASSKRLWGDSETPFGVSHADELQFILPSNRFPRIDLGSPDYHFSKFLVKAWVDFAKNGRPSIPEWIEVETLNNNETSLNWFELNDNPRMFKPVGLNERIQFWDSFNLTDLYI